MINLVKNKCMIGFFIFLIGVTLITSFQERKMNENIFDNNYVLSNIN